MIVIFFSGFLEWSLLDGLWGQNDSFHWKSRLEFLLWEGGHWENVNIFLIIWHKPIPDVWSLTAELHRRKLNRFARTRKRRQWAAAQLCGKSFTFHRVTINLVLVISLPLISQASLNLRKSHPVPVRVIRDDSKNRTLFTRWHHLRINLNKYLQKC